MNYSTRYPGRLVAMVIGLVVVSLVPSSSTAQHTPGRWAIGFHSIGNSWLTDYNKRLIGLGGDVQLRYGVSRYFSLGMEFSLQRYKTKQVPLTADIPTEYLKLNAMPLNLLGWLHFAPGRAIAPYVYFGVGMISYSRQDGLSMYVPDSRRKTALRLPAGLGLQSFFEKGVALDVSVGYAFLEDKTDYVVRGSWDGAVEVRFGLQVYLGSSYDEDEDRDGLTNGEEELFGTNPTNPDTDEDGLTDGAEVKFYGTDPLRADTDGDRLKDGEEVKVYFTNPLRADTDGDGIGDTDEILAGTDPRDPNSPPPGPPRH